MKTILRIISDLESESKKPTIYLDFDDGHFELFKNQDKGMMIKEMHYRGKMLYLKVWRTKDANGMV